MYQPSMGGHYQFHLEEVDCQMYRYGLPVLILTGSNPKKMETYVLEIGQIAIRQVVTLAFCPSSCS
jgi:hypothetical protein